MKVCLLKYDVCLRSNISSSIAIFCDESIQLLIVAAVLAVALADDAYPKAAYPAPAAYDYVRTISLRRISFQRDNIILPSYY